MNNYTKGKWKAIRKEGTHIHRIYSNDAQEICETLMPYGLDENMRSEVVRQAEANALLIAAAPELLAACIECLSVIDRTPNATGLSYEEVEKMPHVRALRSAVKKAGISKEIA